MRKPAFCICENKDADPARYCAADQRLCFHYTDSTIPLLPKSESSSLYSHLLWLCNPVCVGPGRKPRRPVFSGRGSNDLAFSNQPIYKKSTSVKWGPNNWLFEKAKTCTVLWCINLTENDSNEKEISIIFGAKKE